jgi:hypothetical protein
MFVRFFLLAFLCFGMDMVLFFGLCELERIYLIRELCHVTAYN